MLGEYLVSKSLLACLLLLPSVIFADSHDDALKAREQVMRALKGFNPATAMKDYTTSPKEVTLLPNEGNNQLSSKGLDALGSNQSANDIYQKSTSREKVRANPNSSEMKYAETLLENPDSVLEGTCYKEKAVCESKSVTKNCEETVTYKLSVCKERLEVHVKSIIQSLSRVVTPSHYQRYVTFDLKTCPINDWRCSTNSLAVFTEPCESLKVTVSRLNQTLLITKQPTCSDTTITVQLSGWGSALTPLQISITEFVSEDKWMHEDCQRIINQASQGSCVLEGSAQCLESNVIKHINGIAIKRSCWGSEKHYQCTDLTNSNCSSLIQQGCSQTASMCLAAKNNRCERFAQSFQCMENFCMPEKTICPGKIACADGQCDSSIAETSDDIQEGLSRLGALGGVAGDVNANQVKSGAAAIFIGNSQECKKYPLGFRDCCTDSGWGDWVKHCPQDLQVLQRAKQENRVVYLGNYKKHKLGSHHYTYCIFPTKLAAIVQIQGRGGQLGIPYGTAQYPNCRGLTPEELERINFSVLDLSPLQQELMARMALPANGQIGANNQSKVERLNREGRSHD
ncbi:TPA: type-F conjugative transfer system mating-pair stabilization protein TraN [Legionella pneumophila]|nr:type-F conjugative transfer system mating-pair stabilization protein TraN [Legionella pneumophila]